MVVRKETGSGIDWNRKMCLPAPLASPSSLRNLYAPISLPTSPCHQKHQKKGRLKKNDMNAVIEVKGF